LLPFKALNSNIRSFHFLTMSFPGISIQKKPLKTMEILRGLHKFNKQSGLKS